LAEKPLEALESLLLSLPLLLLLPLLLSLLLLLLLPVLLSSLSSESSSDELDAFDDELDAFAAARGNDPLSESESDAKTAPNASASVCAPPRWVAPRLAGVESDATARAVAWREWPGWLSGSVRRPSASVGTPVGPTEGEPPPPPLWSLLTSRPASPPRPPPPAFLWPPRDGVWVDLGLRPTAALPALAALARSKSSW
jgi:hypothetical protein